MDKWQAMVPDPHPQRTREPVWPPEEVLNSVLAGVLASMTVGERMEWIARSQPIGWRERR